ncbi:hypothetical protein GWI33_002282 [Rhynchophorus ferrugineus]|uniref:Uncharacterized protein n=1 Tax=Rhynchophorus ferrugineus TaxID=354439 RepID=A0A834M1F0_RHYFE|nr:hypothetical protein GWI33_002282 [Rhynchophorus ferrugineus]
MRGAEPGEDEEEKMSEEPEAEETQRSAATSEQLSIVEVTPTVRGLGIAPAGPRRGRPSASRLSAIAAPRPFPLSVDPPRLSV